MELTEYSAKHIYSADDKRKWFGEGEWVDEPDTIYFFVNGYKCFIERKVCDEISGDKFGGHLCGYITGLLKALENIDELDVHGGITYHELEKDGYAIGFDCAHYTDLLPSTEIVRKKYNLENTFPQMQEYKKSFPRLFESHYRNIEYVINQLKKLTKQLVEKGIC